MLNTFFKDAENNYIYVYDYVEYNDNRYIIEIDESAGCFICEPVDNKSLPSISLTLIHDRCYIV